MTDVSDDWSPVKQKAADDDWAPVMKTDPMPDALQTSVPEAFLDRVRAGQALTRITRSAISEGREGFGDTTPTGLSDETLQHLIDVGIFHDPLKGRPSPVQFGTEAVALPAAKLWQSITGAVSAGIHGAGGAMGQIVEEFGGSQGTANRAKNEVINAGNWAMIEGGMGRFSRPAATLEGVTDQAIGGLPRPEDFTNAAKVLEPEAEKVRAPAVRIGGDKVFEDLNHGLASEKAEKALGRNLTMDELESGFTTSVGRFVDREEAARISDNANGDLQSSDLNRKVTEANLKRMWSEDGIHPAEAVHDAERDAFLKHDLQTPAIDAYHGSPYSFDAFSTAKIGTGEGAQAYGHGLYFAENAEIATGYRDKLSTGNHSDPNDVASTYLKGLSSRDAAIEALRDNARTYAEGDQVKPDVLNKAVDILESGETPKATGTTYQVRINADPEQMLDWDKPLNQQSPQVQDSLKQAMGDRWNEFKVAKAGDAIKNGFIAPGEEATSAALHDAGIPGIKYLDQRSRQAGEGTRNFVVFNDKDVQITHKNGEPVLPKPSSIEAGLKDFVDNSPEGTAHDLGAAVNTQPPNVPLSVQPASPPGRLAAAFKDAGDSLLSIGRDAQMLTAPMATGTRDSMAMAKDFANSMRRNRWDWSRIDTDIAKRFDSESRRRMWNAADEESLSLKLGEPPHMREHQGLATLDPAERAVVEEQQTRAQNAWVRARDIGMVEGEGLPAYTPRMVINTAGAGGKDGALPLNSIGSNLKTSTGNLLKRKYLEAEETEAAAKAKYGDQAMLARDIRVLPLATSKLEDAIAGRILINNIKEYGKQTGSDTVVEGAIPAGSDTKWFTLDHPAFKTLRPKLAEVEGQMAAVKDAEGNTIFEQVPIYVHGDFEGPLRAVLNEKSGPLYGAMMSLKGKTMSLIMNSPMIHNAVEWGRALPAMPGKVAFFKVYFEGNRAKNNVPLMHEAIDSGLVPIGHRFFNQDITSIMEAPDLTPGRSWTAKILGAVPGLFDEAAGNAVKTAIDKAGNFWHNTLLWDRVADLQMGLYTNFRADAMAKGIDQQTASRMAAHFANRYAGALPKEAMSDAATKVSNMLLFSRSFTMGNLGVIKDMFTGLPKDVIAQIERDAGFRKGGIEAATPEAAEAAENAVDYAKSMARRKAMSVVALDMALMYVGNSLLQNAMNVMVGDSTLEKELHGYATRFKAKMQAFGEHPLELVQPLRLMSDLSSTSENEPGKQERVHVGNAANGTAIYMRNPAGKIGEEFIGYMTGPLDMMRRKLGTIARPAWQVANNDAGFGRKIYDPDADTPGKYLANLGKIAAHIAGSQLPEGQISALSDLVKGEGDKKVNMMQAFGPFIGTTFSKGAPGGPQVGEMYANKSAFEFRVNQAMPDIRRQIQRGDIPGAQQRMTQLGMDPGYSRWVVKTTLNPATRLGPKALRDFYRTASPEQRDRMTRMQAPPASP